LKYIELRSSFLRLVTLMQTELKIDTPSLHCFLHGDVRNKKKRSGKEGQSNCINYQMFATYERAHKWIFASLLCLMPSAGPLLSSRGTGTWARSPFLNVEREHHGTSFPNAVEHESYIGAIIGTSVPSDYRTSWCVCILCPSLP